MNKNKESKSEDFGHSLVGSSQFDEPSTAQQRQGSHQSPVKESIFITGTGTGVGKTVVAAHFLSWLTELSKPCIYYKPIQCGSYAIGNNKSGGDEDWVKDHLRQKYPDLESHTSINFKNPVSPHLAARMEKLRLDFDLLDRDIHKLQKENKTIIVEGAGGIAVPLDEKGTTFIPWILKHKMKVILTCSPYLGTLHHTLTTHHYLVNHGIIPVGYIMCQNAKELPEIWQDNVVTIKKITGMVYLGLIPYVDLNNPNLKNEFCSIENPKLTENLRDLISHLDP